MRKKNRRASNSFSIGIYNTKHEIAFASAKAKAARGWTISY